MPQSTQNIATLVANDNGATLAEPAHPLRQPAIPVLHLAFGQRFDSARVRQAFGVVSRVCKEHGADVSRLFERKLLEGWITCVSVQAQSEFAFEDEARAWWQSLVDRLQRELPHQRLLSRQLKNERFSFTTVQLMNLAGRISGALAESGRPIKDR